LRRAGHRGRAAALRLLSKDAILLLAWRHDSVAFYLLVFTSLLTATYMGRLLVVAFLGRARHEHAEHAHESPWHMLLPLLVLAVGAVAAGYTGLYPHSLSAFRGVSVPHAEENEHGLMIGLSLGLSLGGLLIAWLLYNRPSETRDTLARRVPALYRLAASKLYFDEVYGFYVRNIQQRVANVTAFLEYVVIQGTGVRTIGGALPSILGGAVRMLHTGSVQTYVFWFAAGVIALWLYAAGIF
jgi:NADH-quinone oxidoreductase subunit L